MYDVILTLYIAKILQLSRGDVTRTHDLYVPNVARYQLRHTPKKNVRKSKLFFCLSYTFIQNKQKYVFIDI